MTTTGTTIAGAVTSPTIPGLVYSGSLGGHRENYVRLLTTNLGLAPTVGPMTPAMMQRLVAADRLCFAMIEDTVVGFLLISAARAICRRPTFALLLRPQTCFDGAKIRHHLKRWALSAWRHFPGLTIATILPFEVDPENRVIASVGLHDPEFWDLVRDGRVPAPPESELAAKVRASAAGRPVVVMLGALSRAKGFDIFVRLAKAGSRGGAGSLFVAAGQLHPDSESLAADLESCGGTLVSRRLTDEEIHSFYGVADRVWACYSAEYDQASGIFGRAVQYGVVPIVREGSRVHRFALIEGLQIETLQLNSLQKGLTTGTCGSAAPSRGAQLQGWSEGFWRAARAALALDPKNGQVSARWS